MTDRQMEVLSEQRPDGNVKLRMYCWKEAKVLHYWTDGQMRNYWENRPDDQMARWK